MGWTFELICLYLSSIPRRRKHIPATAPLDQEQTVHSNKATRTGSGAHWGLDAQKSC